MFDENVRVSEWGAVRPARDTFFENGGRFGRLALTYKRAANDRNRLVRYRAKYSIRGKNTAPCRPGPPRLR